MLRLYAMPGSGNSYKIQLLAALLEIEMEQIKMSALDGSTRSGTYLKKNPIGKLPLLELADGRFLPESGAILVYLADGSDFLPDDRFTRAQTLSWMFFEQYSHEPSLAARRSMAVYPERANGVTQATKQALLEKGYAALDVMEAQLQKTAFLAGNSPTIADIALYAYTHDCDKGGFSLENHPQIAVWLTRIEALPNFINMPLQ
ncbi:glutathione S-transferase family protein [Pararhizobium sp. IMCC21322]|uniref:glutathione S-transferase family protein n=1 Tax=Pararhizobium sp. IMCC21322 TaxID=3067903 RepID=UPI002741CA15|nr:glutathione S-transferase family protein [Pararhizobium sp. IMCC21322]